MNLKTIFSILTFSVAFAFSSAAQDKFAKAISSDEFVSSIKTGDFTFVLPEDVSKNDVALSAEYYTMYFSVDFNEKSHIVNINMIENEDRAVHVMQRFFISLEIRDIQYRDKMYTIDEFYAAYLTEGKK